jgi:hypothetical protein
MKPTTRLPISVHDQILMTRQLDPDGKISLGSVLARLSLSTGIHPCVLSHPERFQLSIDDKYLAYTRPKNDRPVVCVLSNAMKADDATTILRLKLGRSIQWYGRVLAETAAYAGIQGRTAFARCRRNYFMNRARLGVDPITIARASGTNLDTIFTYYTIAIEDAKQLTEEDRGSLRWLMEG